MVLTCLLNLNPLLNPDTHMKESKLFKCVCYLMQIISTEVTSEYGKCSQIHLWLNAFTAGFAAYI